MDEDNIMLEKKLRNIINGSELLELADLVELKKLLEKVPAEHKEFNEIVVSKQGAPYYM
jgi:hypothetical protein